MNAARRRALYFVSGKESRIVRTFSAWKPSGVRATVTKLFASRLAATTRTSESANSATISADRKLELVPAELRPPDFSASTGSRCAVASAGAVPNSRVVNSASPNAKANTRASSVAAAIPGTPAGAMAIKARIPTAASGIASTAEHTASTRDSVRSCRTIRARAAPSDMRIAISGRRHNPRATSRFATFTQAMRSATATAPKRMKIGGAHGQHQRLRQKLPHDTGACGSQRYAHSNLRAPPQSAGDQQVRHVHAGNEKRH